MYIDIYIICISIYLSIYLYTYYISLFRIRSGAPVNPPRRVNPTFPGYPGVVDISTYLALSIPSL